MQPVYPPKFCISIVSDFLLGVTVVPRQLEDDGKFFFGGGGWGVGGYTRCIVINVKILNKPFR